MDFPAELVFADSPPYDKKAYQRAYDKTPKARANKRAYRHSKSKWITDEKYLSKRIVAIDGEGINVRSGRRKGDHLYIMLAISDCVPLVNTRGLRTKEILDYLWSNLDRKDINVIYGGSYDFNLWIRDLTSDEVAYLYKSNYNADALEVYGYRLRWMKGKSFDIAKQNLDGKWETITINDVISFFQQPFITACDSYLVTYEGRAELVREKARRGNFTAAEVESVSHYNQLELRLLVSLVGELRSRLNRVGLRPRRWNSPGAIAAALFLRENVKEHLDKDIPAAVAEAARYAYAGGRFEMLKYGAVKEKVYEYDVNSAYPRALLDVPSLANGTWKRHNTDPDTDSLFTLRYVRFQSKGYPDVPGPIFVRGENGTISYPLKAGNWIWGPEYETLKLYCETIPSAKFHVVQAWTFEPATNHKPFGFIAELYKKRQELKAAGDGAHVGIKLALNSLYGKLAQQVGWSVDKRTGEIRPPTYHQLEWAGYVTSWCRAQVLRAALANPEAVVAFETDALFTSEPLPIEDGAGLGDWERTVFDSLTYVQSGHYYGTSEGKEIIKCRGIDKGFISRENVESLLALPERDRVLSASLTRFYGAGIALARGLDSHWCKWLTEPKEMRLMPTGKRMHFACWCYDTTPNSTLILGQWHDTVCPTRGGDSHEYPVAWINPNPKMDQLAEMREGENFYED